MTMRRHQNAPAPMAAAPEAQADGAAPPPPPHHLAPPPASTRPLVDRVVYSDADWAELEVFWARLHQAFPGGPAAGAPPPAAFNDATPVEANLAAADLRARARSLSLSLWLKHLPQNN